MIQSKRTAVMFYRSHSYTAGRRLLGRHRLQLNHLRLLGWHVIDIPQWKWDKVKHDDDAANAYLADIIENHRCTMDNQKQTAVSADVVRNPSSYIDDTSFEYDSFSEETIRNNYSKIEQENQTIEDQFPISNGTLKNHRKGVDNKERRFYRPKKNILPDEKTFRLRKVRRREAMNASDDMLVF